MKDAFYKQWKGYIVTDFTPYPMESIFYFLVSDFIYNSLTHEKGFTVFYRDRRQRSLL